MFLITETRHDIAPITEDVQGVKRYYIDGIFLQANLKNQNGRMYPLSILEHEVDRYVAQYVNESRAYGELGHPNGPSINLERSSHIIRSLTKEGNNFIGRAQIIDTPMGRIVQNILDAGGKLGVSSRGVGSLSSRGNVLVVQEDFHLATAADIVHEPSAPDAFVQGIMEGKEWVWNNGILKETDVAPIHVKVLDSLKRKQSTVKLNEQIAAFNTFMQSLEEA